MFNFNELEMKYGAVIAYQCLTEIERASRIPSWEMTHVDPETRLANAIRAQDTSAPAMMAAA
jgi:hypothetical protein